MLNLHVDITAVADGFEARMIELDIAVRGNSVEDVLAEFAHFLQAEYALARHYHQAPFVRLLPQRRAFLAGGEDEMIGVLTLAHHVVEAIAMVLNVPRFDGVSLTKFRQAA